MALGPRPPLGAESGCPVRHDAWGSGEGPREDPGPGFKRAPGWASTRRCGGHTLHQRWWSIIFPGHDTFHTWVSHLATWPSREVRWGPALLRSLQYRRRAVRLRQPCPLFHPACRRCLCSQRLPGTPAPPPRPRLVAGSSTTSPCCVTLCRYLSEWRHVQRGPRGRRRCTCANGARPRPRSCRPCYGRARTGRAARLQGGVRGLPPTTWPTTAKACWPT